MEHDKTRGTLSYFQRISGSWKELPVIMAMYGNIEYVRIIVKYLLSSVPMVNILSNSLKKYVNITSK